MMANGIHDLRAQLELRLVELQARLSGPIALEPDAIAAAAREVRDTGDESVVIEHADVRTALMQRDAREMNDVQSALVRLDGGSYGVCVDCALEIEPARLRAVPTARRCNVCQQAFEHRAALTADR